MKPLAAIVACALVAATASACGKRETPTDGPPAPLPAPVPDIGTVPPPSPRPVPAPPPAPVVAPTPPTPVPAGPRAVAIPADGKYENVKVCGVTVPMVNIMDGGTVVLVDTDGVKPRSWEEQYKRKGSLPRGWFDLHKTNVNKNDKFDDDPIDRQGRWRMDEKGNITQE